MYSINEDQDDDFSTYEFIVLGFLTENNELPDEIENFLSKYDFGAKTIFPFVIGTNNDSNNILSLIFTLQPGALLGDNALILSNDIENQQDKIVTWANDLPISKTSSPKNQANNTVADATVTPDKLQVLYLWQENNVPAITEYTENNERYFDDPDFRPYLTTFPVPKGKTIKGAVLICLGGAFQYRSDQQEGIDVANELSELGYQCFVVDYRLRPYTQQEGALDLARAVRFVRAHASEYGIDESDIAVMGFSAGGILCGEMLLNFDGLVNGTTLDSSYVADALDQVSADGAACGMIYCILWVISVAITDVELLSLGNLSPTFYCYGIRDPFYDQFIANANASKKSRSFSWEIRIKKSLMVMV